MDPTAASGMCMMYGRRVPDGEQGGGRRAAARCGRQSDGSLNPIRGTQSAALREE